MSRNRPRPILLMNFRTRPALPELIDALTPVVRPSMREAFDPDCCIATCRILRRVFARFGYAAEALPCAVSVSNPAMTEYLASGGYLPDDDEELLRLCERLGAWRIGMKPIPQRTGFQGHVVLRVEHMLVDASLDQVDRPAKKIFMPPLLAFEPFDAFWAKPGEHGGEVRVNGCSVVYQPLSDYSFRTTPGWLREGWPCTDVFKKIVGETRTRLGL
jgi:hypothetical protein